MVDNQIDRRQRIDLLGVAAQLGQRLAHGREVDHGRHAGEVLQQNAGRAIGDLAVGTPVLQPLAEGANVVRRHAAAVLEAQQVLQQHLHGIGQARNVAELRGGRLQTVVAVGLAADLEVAAGLQGVFGWHEGSLLRLRWAAPDSLAPGTAAERSNGLAGRRAPRPVATAPRELTVGIWALKYTMPPCCPCRSEEHTSELQSLMRTS